MDKGSKKEAPAQAAPAGPLADHHRRMLEEESAIAPDVIAERGYRTVWTPEELPEAFAGYQRLAPGLLIPRYSTLGTNGFYQYRPDRPRHDPKRGRDVKYESPPELPNLLGIHPRTHRAGVLRDPSILLAFVEGAKKADALLSAGIHAVDLTGVFNYRGRDERRLAATLADFGDIVLEGRRCVVLFDSDIRDNPNIQRAATGLVKVLERGGAKAWIACPEALP